MYVDGVCVLDGDVRFFFVKWEFLSREVFLNLDDESVALGLLRV